jgi:hypothetical protein
LKSPLVFAGTVLAVAVAAFALGYRTPTISLPPTRGNIAQPEASGTAASDNHPVFRMPTASDAVSRDGLQVQGFAKIGSREMEEVLTSASPEQRQQWALQLAALPDQPLKRIAFVAFYTAWLDFDPEQALRSLRDFPDRLSRVAVFGSLAPPPGVLPAFIDIVAEFSEAERQFILPELLASLEDVDPRAAANFIDSHPKVVSTPDAIRLVSAWARDDIDGATKWLETSQIANNSEALNGLVTLWLTKDPAAARDYVVLHRQSDGIEQAAESVAAHLFHDSPDQARAFISSFDDQRATTLALTLVGSAVDTEVAGAVAWISTLPPKMQEVAMGVVLPRWQDVDPQGALAWLRLQPADQRAALLLPMMDIETVSRSPELLSIVYGLSDARARDAVLSTFVHTLGSGDEAAAQIRSLGLSAVQTNHLLQLSAATDPDVQAPGNP